jgi:hypothetical protein
MQTNLSGGLVTGFYGITAINGVPARHHGSIDDTVRKPGFISNNATEGAAIFGVMMCANKVGNAAELFPGAAADANSVMVGPLLNNQGIRENDPAKPNWQMNGTPATTVIEGTLLYNSWLKNASGSGIDPLIGCRVIANNTTGEIQFQPAGNAVPTGWTQAQAQVIDVDTFTGVVVIHFGPPATT